MGDDIGSGSLTDCRLRSFSDHRRHTQQCRTAPWQKSKQMQPKTMSSPINYPDYTGQHIVKTQLCAVRRSRHLAHSQIKSEDLLVRTNFSA